MKLKLLFILLMACGFAQAEVPIFDWVKKLGEAYYYLNPCITTDSKGCIYMTGSFSGDSITLDTFTILNSRASNTHYFIAKFDSTGKVIWAKSSAKIDNGAGTAIKTDKNGDILVGGYFLSPTITFGSKTLSHIFPLPLKQFFLTKYDATGNVIWAITSKDPNNNVSKAESIINSVDIDDFGNVYCSGSYSGGQIVFDPSIADTHTESANTFLAKYNRSGDFIWVKSYPDYNKNISSVAVDTVGNVLLAGNFTFKQLTIESYILTNAWLPADKYDTGLETDIFIVKYTPAGKLLWARSAGGPGKDVVYSLSIDTQNNFFIAGCFAKDLIKFGSFTLNNNIDPSRFSERSFIAKYDSNGSVTWAKMSSGFSTDKIVSTAVDSSGNVYALGFTRNKIKFDSYEFPNSYSDNFYFLKLDPLGQVQGLKTGGGNGFDYGSSIAVDNRGFIYTAGNYAGTGVNFDFLTMKNNTRESELFVARILYKKTYEISYPFCPHELSVSITALDNYNSYTWVDINDKLIGNSQTFTIDNPVDSAVYICKFKDSMDSTFIVRYTLVENNMNPDFLSSKSDCTTNMVQFTNQSTTNIGSLIYLWDFGDGTSSTESSPIHKYTTIGEHTVSLLIINKESGCTDSISKTISFYPKPLITITGDSTLCHGTPVTLKVQGADSYKWSTGSTAESISVNSAQKVWVVGYSASGCVSDTAFLNVTDRTPVVTISGKATYCPGGSVTLKAHGAYSYTWSNGATSDSIQVSSPCTVWVVGHNSTCTSDTVKYTVSEEPDFNVSVEGNLFICSGGSTVLTASGADSYRWSTGETTNSVTIHRAGDYTVTGINNRGCEKTISLHVAEAELPVADFMVTPATVDTRHNSVSCLVRPMPGVSYTWDMGDGSYEYGAKIQHVYAVSNNLWDYKITLTATNASGCVSTVSKTVDIVLFVPNIFSPNGDGVNDVFMPDVELEIFDRNGITLYKGTDGWNGTYQGKKMSDDTYYYAIKYKDKNGQVQIKKGYVLLKR